MVKANTRSPTPKRRTRLPICSISPASTSPRIGFLGRLIPRTSRTRNDITRGAPLKPLLPKHSLNVTAVA